MSEESSSRRKVHSEQDSVPEHPPGVQADREAPVPYLRPQDPTVHVIQYQPEIPQNTGNIARTCVATGAKLWLVRPLGFQIDERSVRRAGLDYWVHLNLQVTDSFSEIRQQLPGATFWYFSRFAKRSLWDAEIALGDAIVFGRESTGLPSDILDPCADNALRIPTTENVRSLNVSNTAAIAVFEVLRKNGLC